MKGAFPLTTAISAQISNGQIIDLPIQQAPDLPARATLVCFPAGDTYVPITWRQDGDTWVLKVRNIATSTKSVEVGDTIALGLLVNHAKPPEAPAEPAEDS